MSKRPVADAFRPNRSRKPLVIGLAVVAVLVVGAVVASLLGHQSDGNKPAAEQRTVKVQRTSLAAGFTLSGYLGYGDPQTLSGKSGGIVTQVPAAGAIIQAGQVIMAIEGAPVFLLQGDLPLWREIGPDVTGVDVQNLRDSLAKIGIDAGQGQTYDAALSTAIATLYKNAGLDQPIVPASVQAVRNQAKSALDAANQALSQAQAALTQAQDGPPDPTQVAQLQQVINEATNAYQSALQGRCGAVACTTAIIAQLRNNVDTAQLAYNQFVSQPPDTTAQRGAVSQAQNAVAQAQKTYNDAMQNSVGPDSVLIVAEPTIRVDEVKATLGQPLQGPVLTWTKTVLYGQATLTDAQQRMLSTGTPATLTWSDGTSVKGTVGKITESRLDTTTGQNVPGSVRIDVADQTQVAQHGPSAVTVSFIQDEAADTLVVPVTALVVPAEGGYAVQRADGTFVRVTLGLIADTRVQVFSDDLKEGDLVVVP